MKERKIMKMEIQISEEDLFLLSPNTTPIPILYTLTYQLICKHYPLRISTIANTTKLHNTILTSLNFSELNNLACLA